MAESNWYAGMVRYVQCPLCGTEVKLTYKGNYRWEGTCPNCKKHILE